MKKEDIPHIRQLISALEESAGKLEVYHEKKDNLNFDKTKNLTVKLFSQISEILEEKE